MGINLEIAMYTWVQTNDYYSQKVRFNEKVITKHL